MSKKKAFFQDIDIFLFKQVDLLKNHVLYAKYREAMSGLPNEVIPWVNRGLMFLLLIFPIFFLLIFGWSNSNYRLQIQKKEEILFLANKIIKEQKEISQTRGVHIGLFPIRSQSDFDGKIREAATEHQLDMALLQITHFELQTEGHLIVAKGQLSYNKLAILQLVQLLQSLESKHRMKISGLKIRRNPAEELLEGQIDLTYYTWDNPV